MTFEVRPSPTFVRWAKEVFGRFPLMKPDIKKYLEDLETTGPVGDQMPRFAALWKDRIAMKPYNIGARGGLRFIAHLSPTSKCVVPLFLYYKGDKSDVTTLEVRSAMRELQGLPFYP